MDVAKVLTLKNQLINIVEKIQLSLFSPEFENSNLLQLIQDIKPELKTVKVKINDEKRNHSIFGGLDQLSLLAANQETVKKEKIQYAKRLDLMNQIAIDSEFLLNILELLEYYLNSQQFPVIKNALCYLVDIILIELKNWTDEDDSTKFIEKYNWSRLIDALMQFEKFLNFTSANSSSTQTEFNINSISNNLQTYRFRLNEQYEELIQNSLELQRQQQEAELKRQQQEEELKRQQQELQRQREAELKRQQQEKELKRQRKLELKRQQQELQRQQEAELKRQQQEKELKRQQEEELQRQRELELQRQQEAELKRQQQELKRQQEEELQRQQEELELKRQQQELQRQTEAELKRQQAEELKRQQQEAELKRQQEELELKHQREAELKRQQEEEELQRQQEEELQRQREAELKRQQEEEELQRQREAELKRQQEEEELQRQQQEELQRQQEAELQQKRELELQRQQEAELKRQKEAELQQKRELELQRQQEAELKRQKEAELQQKQGKEIRQLIIIVAGVILLGGIGFLIFNPFNSKQSYLNIQTSENPQDRLKTAENLALEASKIIENPPYPLTVWQQAQTQMQDAIQLLEGTPKNSSNSQKINQKLEIYKKDYQSINQILNKEQKAKNNLEEAKKIAMEASVMLQNPPNSLIVWQEAEEKWKKSINLLESIPQDSFIYSESQDRLKIYQTNHQSVSNKIKLLNK